jgi:hypothetical protein
LNKLRRAVISFVNVLRAPDSVEPDVRYGYTFPADFSNNIGEQARRPGEVLVIEMKDGDAAFAVPWALRINRHDGKFYLRKNFSVGQRAGTRHMKVTRQGPAEFVVDLDTLDVEDSARISAEKFDGWHHGLFIPVSTTGMLKARPEAYADAE